MSSGRGGEDPPRPPVREVPSAYETWVGTSQSGILAAKTFSSLTEPELLAGSESSP